MRRSMCCRRLVQPCNVLGRIEISSMHVAVHDGPCIFIPLRVLFRGDC